MDDFALVLNAGSSSLKFCVFQRPDRERWRLGARGQIEGIGTSPQLSVKDANLRKVADEQLDTTTVQNGSDAIGALAVWLRSQYAGARVLGVGHRVVHGGAKFTRPVVVTPEIVTELKELIPLAPLHQPYNLAAIEAVEERLPGVPQVACFDTSFHRDHAPVADLIPLPREVCKGGLQRYGFHGLSYEYIASTLPEVAPEIARGKDIGALAAALGGIDALVFTAGSGENSPEIRRRVCEASAWLGIEIDANSTDQKATRISTAQSKTSVWVIPTNEELMIALHTGELL